MRLPAALPRPTVALAAAVVLVVAGGILIACGSNDGPATDTAQSGPVASGSPAATSAATATSAASPSAKPSPKPSPSPKSPSGWPNADSTGVQAGVKLAKRHGEILVKKSGTVIENIDLVGDIRVEANNVTVRNVRITNVGIDDGPTYWGVMQWMGYSGLVVEHVDIIGSAKQELTMGVVSFGGKVTVRYADISGVSKKAIETSRGLLEENYLHSPHNFKQADGEVDLIRVSGGPSAGGSLTIRHNTILNPLPVTSAVGVYSESGNPAHDMLVENNFIGGGGYSLYAGGEDDPTYNLVFRGNVFSTKVKGTFGPAVFFNPRGKGNVWQNNKWESGKAVR